MTNNNELIFLGGIGNNLWLDNGKRYSRNFKQGYRVYDSIGLACSITSQGGGLGGQSGIYLVRKEIGDMKIIGVTGGIGAGKSTVLKYIELYYNCEVFVTDIIAYDIMRNNEKCLQEIKDAFSGCDIFNNLGVLDSLKVGKVIFSDDEKRKQMNAIVHPKVIQYVRDECARIEKEGNKDFVVVESALLIESGLVNYCNEVWYITAPENVRIERLKAGRGYTTQKCRNIINGQLSDEEFMKYANVIINTGDSYQNTYMQIDNVLKNFSKKQKGKSDDIVDNIADNLV